MMTFQAPQYDIQTNEVYLKGNLRVKGGDKLFVFGKTTEMHFVCGYYLKDEFVGMCVWPDLRISQMCLMKEIDVCGVETFDNRFYICAKNGFIFQKHVSNRAKRIIIKDIHHETTNDN